MMKQCVDQRMLAMACARVNDETRRLVDHQEFVILE